MAVRGPDIPMCVPASHVDDAWHTPLTVRPCCCPRPLHSCWFATRLAIVGDEQESSFRIFFISQRLQNFLPISSNSVNNRRLLFSLFLHSSRRIFFSAPSLLVYLLPTLADLPLFLKSPRGLACTWTTFLPKFLSFISFLRGVSWKSRWFFRDFVFSKRCLNCLLWRF